MKLPHGIGMKKMICSQCEKEANEMTCYKSNTTGEVWCQTCVAKIKKKRNTVRYKKRFRGTC